MYRSPSLVASMIRAVLLSIAMSALGSAISDTHAGNTERLHPRLLLNETCHEIAVSTSAASDVYDVGSFIHVAFLSQLWLKDVKHVAASLNYAQDIMHWASSSTQIAVCSFEPGTVEDVGIVVNTFGLVDVPVFTKRISFSYEFWAKPELHLRFVLLRLKMIQGLHTPTGQRRWSRHQPGVFVDYWSFDSDVKVFRCNL